LRIGTIADLITYRRRNEKLVRRVAENTVWRTLDGAWQLIVYEDTVHGSEHLAVVKGSLSEPGAVHVRVHARDLISDLLLGRRVPPMRAAMAVIADKGRGVLVCLGDYEPSALSKRIKELELSDKHSSEHGFLRHYGIGAQILKDLGV